MPVLGHCPLLKDYFASATSDPGEEKNKTVTKDCPLQQTHTHTKAIWIRWVLLYCDVVSCSNFPTAHNPTR